MLIMYNESKINWLNASINDRTTKFTTSRTLKDGKTKYLDVFMNAEMNVDPTQFVSMENCEVLYDGNTSVKFKNKDLKPFITTSDKYNTDVIFININLGGKIIKSIEGNNSILSYLIAQGELFLIVSLREKDHKYFEIIMHDPNTVTDTIYKFEGVNKKYVVDIEVEQANAVVSKPSFKITRFRPAKPTNAIFANEYDTDLVLKALKYPDSHNIVSYKNNDLDDLYDRVTELKKSGYKAVTLYVNAANFTGPNDKYYGAEFEMLKSNFKILNILLEDGKVLRR